MRTHAVPTDASANGSTSSATAISASPTHAERGILVRVEEVAHDAAAVTGMQRFVAESTGRAGTERRPQGCL